MTTYSEIETRNHDVHTQIFFNTDFHMSKNRNLIGSSSGASSIIWSLSPKASLRKPAWCFVD